MSRRKAEAVESNTQASPEDPATVTPMVENKSPTGAAPPSGQSAALQEFDDRKTPTPETPNPSANGENPAPQEVGDEKQYPPEPNPRAWAENLLAGVQFRTVREPFEAELVFKEKPSQPVIDFIKDNGFRWNREAKVWTRPVGYSTQAQDRLIASRTYHKAVNMILQEKGLDPQPEHTPF